MEKMFYKVAVLFKGSLTEEEANAEYTKVTEELKMHGIITQEVKPNKIVLAYPIAKSTEAYFATVKFEPAENTTLDFKDWLKKADVLRVLITKNDNVTVEKVTGFSPALKAVEDENLEEPMKQENVGDSAPALAAEETVEFTPAEESAANVETEAKKEPEVDLNALDEKLEELLK